MRIIRNMFRRMLYRLAYKVVYFLMAVIIGILVWCTILSPSVHDKATELIDRGRDLYQESTGVGNHPHYDIRQDSSATYIYEDTNNSPNQFKHKHHNHVKQQ